MFAGRVKIVSHSSCRASTKLKYFCPLKVGIIGFAFYMYLIHDVNELDSQKQACFNILQNKI